MTKDHEGAFRTHANYLRAFALLRGFEEWADNDGALAEVRSKVLESDGYVRLQAASDPDLFQIRASLVNAWGTELLLELSGQFAHREGSHRLGE